MNKKGFTLVEILVVIVLIGALMLLIVPSITGTFRGSVNKTMQVQENRVEEAALAYLEDYCKNPISKAYVCPVSRNADYTYSGNITLNSLILAGYIDSVKIQDTTCSGYVTITNNKAKAYLSCADQYTTSGFTN